MSSVKTIAADCHTASSLEATSPSPSSAPSTRPPSQHGNSRFLTDEIIDDPNAIELQTVDSRASTVNSERELNNLPEPDRGLEAYRFLFVAFVVETVVWGLPSSYGVFLNYYTKNGVHGHTFGAGLLPLVGTVASGMMYLLGQSHESSKSLAALILKNRDPITGPAVSILLNPNPRLRPNAIRFGCFIVVLALLLSSFSRTAWQLLLTQGVLYSIGGSLAYYPTFTYLSEWFVQRRGFANGIVFAGTAAGGLVYPFVLEYLLSKYGADTTLQALSVFTALLLGASLPWLRPRIPLPQKGWKKEKKNEEGNATKERRKSLWKSKKLWIFMLANVAQAFGYFLPTLYLPTYASSLGLSGAAASGTLACVNASAVISRVVIGAMSDRMSPHLLGAIILSASALSVLILWGVTSTSLVPLLIFSLILGIACGGWTSLYSSIIKSTSSDDPNLSSTLFGLISFTRGLGSILTAPVSTFLLNHPLEGASRSTGYGVQHGKYGSLVLFAGLSLLAAAGIEVVLSV